ncbi:MAG: hypothetical protein QME41_10685 [Actinomycetota bacterium]|nr:hypothetical protein [Actinomycetota bacterium]
MMEAAMYQEAYSYQEDTETLWLAAEDNVKRGESKKASAITKAIVHYLLEDTIGVRFEPSLVRCFKWEHFVADSKQLTEARRRYLLAATLFLEERGKFRDALLSFFESLPVEKEQDWQACIIEILERPSEEPTVSEDLLSTSVVAEKFHVSQQAVIKWCEKGKIKAIRTPGGTWKIPAGQFKTSKEQDKALDSFFGDMWKKRASKPPVSDEDIVAILKERRKG